MHQFYQAVRTSEGEESAEQSGKPRLIIYIFVIQWGRGDVTVRALVSGSSGLGSSPDRGQCVVFLLSQYFSPSRCIKGYWQI